MRKQYLMAVALFGAGLYMQSAPAVEHHHFDADGLSLRYFDAGQGPTVILLHGMSGSAEGAWINPGTFEKIVEAGFRAVALEHRGHGGSAKPHDPAFYGVEMADDVGRLLDHLGVDRAHIVGYSLGGKIANTFRERHPGRLQSLTLGGYGWPWQQREVSVSEARRGLETRALPGNDLDALAAMLSRVNELTPTEKSLRDNPVPTLSIVGSAEEVVPRDAVLALRTTMARVESVDMPGTHAGPDGALYKPEFAEHIVRFLKRHTQ